jgi:hypothetical protein
VLAFFCCKGATYYIASVTFALPTFKPRATMNCIRYIFFFFAILVWNSAVGQMNVTVNHTANTLLDVLLGQGVTVSNVTATGLQSSNGNVWSAGIFSDGIAAGIGIDSGIVMTSGNALLAIGPNNQAGAGSGNGNPGDPNLTAVAGSNTNDACVLEFDFFPLYDTITFRYVFGSDEYHQYVNSINDVFAFFITGQNPAGGNYTNQNIAIIPVVNQVVSINTINFGSGPDCPHANGCLNCAYLIDNCQSGKSIEYDAYTIVMTATAYVVPCTNYHLKIAIADAVDGVLDSGVFLEAGSFSSPGIAITPVYTTPGGGSFAVEGCTQADLIISLPVISPDTTWLVFDSIRGTAINGVDCNLLNDSLMILPGELSDTINIVPIFDNIVEVDETLIFYYSSSTPCMGTTVASVTVTIADFTKVNLGPDDTICQGQAMVFNAGPGYMNYTWQDGSKLQTFNATTTGTYTVLVEDEYGCTSSDSADLLVAPLPVAIPIKHN